MENKIKNVKENKSIRRASWLFMAPAIFFFFIFGWYPLILGLIVSFQSFHLVKPSYFIGLENFRAVFRDPLTVIVFKNTFYYTALSLVLTFLLPIFVAILLMEMRRKTIRLMMILWFVPLASIASMTIWKYFYSPEFGLFNAILSGLHLPTLKWLLDKRITMLCLVLPGLIMYGPGLIYIGSLQGIPEELYEAAELEGSNLRQKIWYVTLPRLRPVIAVMLILSMVGCMQIFDQPKVMTGGGPGNATRSVVMFYYELAFESYRMGKGQALALVLFSVLVLLLYIQRKYFKEDIDR